LPGPKPALQAGRARGFVAGEAQGQRHPHQPDEREQDAPADSQRARRGASEDDLDGERADQVAGERGAVEREGAANLVAKQQEAVERRLAGPCRRRVRAVGRRRYGDGRGGQGVPLVSWLTASTACVRELTPSARNTAAT